ncbi:hypothetical protein SAY87_005185 [Trapa incisa]|uniref:Uncharacterized protein n=1 Tax=Trapa incisa TaxID=236973 RepID=A0AAN7Q6C4_9MYRT|nr:hypothetical protein SAY87_005185 [Trapa incisa]
MEEQKKLEEALGVGSNINVVDLIGALYGCGDGDRFALVIGSTGKTTCKVEYLREKNVLLLMTDTMNIAEKDLSVLKTIYRETKFKEEGYEIVWIPLVDGAAAAIEKHSESFVRLREQMPWCIPRNLVPVTESVIKVVKESCYLEKESIVVVKDRSGYTWNPNAMNMISLWGSEAFSLHPVEGARTLVGTQGQLVRARGQWLPPRNKHRINVSGNEQ